MYRIDNATAAAALPASTDPGPNPDSFFTDGDPGGGIPATEVPAEWFNMVQEEIAGAVEAAGDVLDKTDNAQLAAAIVALAALGAADLLAQNNTWLKGQRGKYLAVAYAASQDIDMASAQHFEITLGGNPIMNDPTNLVVGQEGTITFIQDATGSRAPSGWGTYWSFEDSVQPDFTTTPTKKDTFAYFVRAADEVVLKPAVRNY
jgi:hypothetical protein